MELLKEIFSFLTDKDKHFSTKAGIALLAMIGVYFINDITGFNYYYNMNNRIEKINSINQILKDSLITGNEKTQLITMRSEILNHKNTINSSLDNIGDAYNALKLKISSNQKNNVKHSESVGSSHSTIKRPERNDFAFLITSSGIYLFIIFIIFPVGVFTALKSGKLFDTAVGMAALSIMLAIPASISYYMFGLIPIIGNNWGWNYALNCLLQMGLLTILGVSINSASNK